MVLPHVVLELRSAHHPARVDKLLQDILAHVDWQAPERGSGSRAGQERHHELHVGTGARRQPVEVPHLVSVPQQKARRGEEYLARMPHLGRPLARVQVGRCLHGSLLRKVERVEGAAQFEICALAYRSVLAAGRTVERGARVGSARVLRPGAGAGIGDQSRLRLSHQYFHRHDVPGSRFGRGEPRFHGRQLLTVTAGERRERLHLAADAVSHPLVARHVNCNDAILRGVRFPRAVAAAHLLHQRLRAPGQLK